MSKMGWLGPILASSMKYLLVSISITTSNKSKTFPSVKITTTVNSCFVAMYFFHGTVNSWTLPMRVHPTLPWSDTLKSQRHRLWGSISRFSPEVLAGTAIELVASSSTSSASTQRCSSPRERHAMFQRASEFQRMKLLIGMLPKNRAKVSELTDVLKSNDKYLDQRVLAPLSSQGARLYVAVVGETTWYGDASVREEPNVRKKDVPVQLHSPVHCNAVALLHNT